MGDSNSFLKTPRAPGAKKRKGRYFTKGRQLDPQSLVEVRTVLKNQPLHKDLAIEHLHRLQDTFGHLKKRHLVALASEMHMALAEIYEIATFYHNFKVAESDEDTPKLTVKVCDSLTCEMAGSAVLAKELAENFGKEIEISHGACMGRCDKAPVVRIKDHYVLNATLTKTADELKAYSSNSIKMASDHTSYQEYKEQGGFASLNNLYSGALSSEEILTKLRDTNHRGLGGAGFPHHLKIQSVLSVPGPRLMAVNADESEPGTFKDRYYMNNNPYQFLEGMLIAAELVEADEIYIFLRDEYSDTAEILKEALAQIKIMGLTKNRTIYLRRGAGAYICGEESAMLESLEGKRALPRHKPPFPSQVGLFGKPTLINNVETLYWLPEIIVKDPSWYSKSGRHGATGYRTFSLSGPVNKPGVYRTPAGITASELIEEFGGGMKEGYIFKAYLPGGASGGALPAAMADIPMDFGTLEPHGCFIGSAAVIVLSDKDNLKDVARNLMRFFEDESCGQCTPCRAGTEKALLLMKEDSWDTDLLVELSDVMRDASICGLGQAAPNGFMSLLKHFPEELK
ncbi:MAG: NAD(P)H-dependent oxidoreductase subunit E [Sneathiella sp.]